MFKDLCLPFTEDETTPVNITINTLSYLYSEVPRLLLKLVNMRIWCFENDVESRPEVEKPHLNLQDAQKWMSRFSKAFLMGLNNTHIKDIYSILQS